MILTFILTMNLQTQSVMSRPRPGTRRFYLDRKDIDQLCGSRIANRLRQKIPTKVVEAEHSLAAKKN
jgi:hypothetical protein